MLPHHSTVSSPSRPVWTRATRPCGFQFPPPLTPPVPISGERKFLVVRRVLLCPRWCGFQHSSSRSTPANPANKIPKHSKLRASKPSAESATTRSSQNPPPHRFPTAPSQPTPPPQPLAENLARLHLPRASRTTKQIRPRPPR